MLWSEPRDSISEALSSPPETRSSEAAGGVDSLSSSKQPQEGAGSPLLAYTQQAQGWRHRAYVGTTKEGKRQEEEGRSSWGDTGALPLAPIYLTSSKPKEELFNPPAGPGWNRAGILYIMGGRGKTWAVN